MIRIVFLSILLIGCAANKSVAKVDLLLSGRDKFDSEFLVFHVPSHGALPDSIAISTYRSQGNSSVGKELYNVFVFGNSDGQGVVVGGSNRDLTLAVVENAFDQEKGIGLDGLHVLLVGPTDLTQNLIAKCESLGVKISVSGQ